MVSSSGKSRAPSKSKSPLPACAFASRDLAFNAAEVRRHSALKHDRRAKRARCTPPLALFAGKSHITMADILDKHARSDTFRSSDSKDLESETSSYFGDSVFDDAALRK